MRRSLRGSGGSAEGSRQSSGHTKKNDSTMKCIDAGRVFTEQIS